MFAPLLLCCLPLTVAAADACDPAPIAEPADDWQLGAGPVAPVGLPRGELSRESFAAFVRSDGAGRDGRRVALALALLIAATADPDDPLAPPAVELAAAAKNVPAAIERTAAVVSAEADRVFASPPDRATFAATLGDPFGDDPSTYRVSGFADWPTRTLHLTAWPAAGGEPVAGLDVGTLTPAACTAEATRYAVRFDANGRCVGGRAGRTELTLTHGPAAAIAAPAADRPDRTVADLGSLWAALMPRYMAFLAKAAAESD